MPVTDQIGRQFTAPHHDLYRAMRAFMADLEGAEKEYREEVVAIRKKLGVPAQYTETFHVERCSLAVQVLAAAAIEAIISLYAVLRFGGHYHDRHFRWDSAASRLSTALEYAGIAVDQDDEMLVLVRRVMEARNRIVHPFSVEFTGDGQATIRSPDRLGPNESAAAARMAVADVDRFLVLLCGLDDANSIFLSIC
jgi:hypothetical protein